MQLPPTFPLLQFTSLLFYIGVTAIFWTILNEKQDIIIGILGAYVGFRLTEGTISIFNLINLILYEEGYKPGDSPTILPGRILSRISREDVAE